MTTGDRMGGAAIRPHNHVNDGHHWQDCSGCDDRRLVEEEGPDDVCSHCHRPRSEHEGADWDCPPLEHNEDEACACDDCAQYLADEHGATIEQARDALRAALDEPEGREGV